MENEAVLYNYIGAGYNTTRKADPYLTEQLYRFLSPHPNGLYLDIGCGTGNYTTALANRGLNFYGVEPSEKMLDIAKSACNKVYWLVGGAEQIPADDETFDGAIATLTIHHWQDLRTAFDEISRVLKDNGKLILFTATPEQMEQYWLNHYFPKMLKDSIAQMPAFETIKNAAVRAGFMITQTKRYFIKDDLQDYFLYSGKNRPGLYFNEEIRKGISSFSALASLEEVQRGLAQLQNDLKLNKFEAIRANYNDDAGDYLFIIAEKSPIRY